MTEIARVWADLPWWGWAVAVAAALVAGLAKTAIGNLALLTAVVFAQLLPTKDSTGVVLLLFLTGDLVAVWVYRRSVDWRLIGRLIVPVAVGIGLGAFFLEAVSDTVLKKTIGAITLVLLVLGFWPDKLSARRRPVAHAYGGLSGFTTMVANMGGPAMSLYLLAARFDKLKFLGTTAWFFFAVNSVKVPVSIRLGIVRWEMLPLAFALAPAVLIGTWMGRIVVQRLDQKTFERLVLAFVAVSAVYL
ncbi:MAG: sulfite exporter TauE/SafE family protein, partial [Propionibacteriaceae bacterium]|nr:sulfite exporter TauE/SafE family protein [Propionibacteriaceae bacterium]